MAKDVVADALAGTILDLTKRIERLLSRQSKKSQPHARILIVLAGVPGSGKSTVSRALLTELASRRIDDVTVVPMLRFELRKYNLSAEEARLSLSMRTPFVELVRAIKALPVTSGDEFERFLYAPSFDHATKDPVQDAIPISSRNRLIILEANYTLLDQSPWNEIAKMCEEKWFVDVPAEIAQERLVQRHFIAGIEISALTSTARVTENDLPNGEPIRSLLMTPNVVIEN